MAQQVKSNFQASRPARRGHDPLQDHDPWTRYQPRHQDDHVAERAMDTLSARDSAIRSMFYGLASGGASRQVVSAAAATVMRLADHGVSSDGCGQLHQEAVVSLKKSVDRSASCDALDTHEAIIRLGKLHVADLQHLGDLARHLRQHGLLQLARRVRLQSQHRHAVAHPDADLLVDLSDALHASSSTSDEGASPMCDPAAVVPDNVSNISKCAGSSWEALTVRLLVKDKFVAQSDADERLRREHLRREYAAADLQGSWMPLVTPVPGSLVKIVTPFMSDQQLFTQWLPHGLVGKIDVVDEDGDVRVLFPFRDVKALSDQWVLSENFDLLQVWDPPGIRQ